MCSYRLVESLVLPQAVSSQTSELRLRVGGHDFALWAEEFIRPPAKVI
jgi:hypothetical protein